MNSKFETLHFQSRKFLLSMQAGESRMLPVYLCKYASIKSTAYQLKKMGRGEWKCTKKITERDVFTKVTRMW